MRWPWQRKSDAPKAAEIAEHAVKSEKVLRRAFNALRTSTTEGIDAAERRVVDDYARADLDRRGRSKP